MFAFLEVLEIFSDFQFTKMHLTAFVDFVFYFPKHRIYDLLLFRISFHRPHQQAPPCVMSEQAQKGIVAILALSSY